ncbi:DNA alkylation repair protein [Saccharopolyspora dendranthemae]|uniref:3-methyladenine DNA glycosylase AlkD n=1 Tax=Saccharopolyspora dendranthemae TaxID=1181886 RepID=A0A561U6V5_9PSEU|nr:DNA alkylation repair protein [Saccharopolyspora dendranthemae]TWF95104.1 3-methyladenine DNA glycosylase AlkD [Saccharopolyspora dendranthemae]
MSEVPGFCAEALRLLDEQAVPADAPAMQRYMKSEMPFVGVRKPPRVQIVNELCRRFAFPERDDLIDTTRALWRNATYREERYVALSVTGHRTQRAFQDPGMLGPYEEFVVTGAWWDLVDETASHRVGPLLLSHPDQVRPLLLRWSTDEDRWRRRTAIIAQLRAKDRTDVELLRRSIEANLTDQDFFLRKAIGWALREHAKTDPGWVREFTENHDLSPLSRREALRNIDR